jgi:hypothetical protein|tara:strand:- start:115 stop:339 length:225 start_codon:yes stop_codon:yes gene_type:complete
MNNFQNTFNAAVRNPQNWRKDGIDWNFVDADVYESMSIFCDGETYTNLFDYCADEWEKKFSEISNYLQYRKALV